ncbi:MAG: STAS domain-containing protein [Solirubrobacteraceae bacterium]|nr:STAS domain-containing protein [Solirubrobacteraceae bacterium]
MSVHPQRGAVRVAPCGELDVASAASLQAQLDELRVAGFEHVVLDLRELTFMDSSGVRLILGEDRLARSAGRRFSLIAGVPAVQRVLGVCGVSAQLDLDDRFAEPASGRVVWRHADVDRQRLSIAFQGYVAQLRRQGRSTRRLSPR